MANGQIKYQYWNVIKSYFNSTKKHLTDETDSGFILNNTKEGAQK